MIDANNIDDFIRRMSEATICKNDDEVSLLQRKIYEETKFNGSIKLVLNENQNFDKNKKSSLRIHRKQSR